MTEQEKPQPSPAREAAEIRKITAEVDQIERNIALAEAELARKTEETGKLQEERRKLAAEADRAEHEARNAKVYAEIQEREHRLNSTDDYYHRVYWFDKMVNESSVKDCIRVLRTWDRLDPECEITIVFNSPGGSVIHGMALFDELVTMSLHGGGRHPITTMIRGYAASMAGILLQAGDHRVAGAEAYLMIHEVSAGTGGKIGEIQDQVKFYEKICERVADIFVTRSGGKTSKTAFSKGWKRQDWWLDSKDALKHGFIDEIR